jgi:vacuolar-type H+-ATPase subunit D/Vma8
MDLGQAFRKLFKDIDNASQRIRQFENEIIPGLFGEIQSQKKII